MYKAICKLYHLNYEKKLGKGKCIDKNMRLTNTNGIFKKNFDTKNFLGAIGNMHFYDFEDSTYIYKIGDDDDFDVTNPIEGLNDFLANIQMFLSMSWFIKDNSIAMENAFVISDFGGENESTSVSSRIVNFTSSRGEHISTTFSDEEIDEVIKLYDSLHKVTGTAGDKKLLFNSLERDNDRINRFIYLLQPARNESYIPMKISLYTTMLECLLSTSNNNIAHMVAERSALLIGETKQERIEIYNFIKEMYSIRSKVLHGDVLSNKFSKKDYEDIKDISERYDTFLRRIVLKIMTNTELKDIYTKNNKEDIDAYYLDLIMK